MATDRQRDANRRNAQLSSGPKTAAGKANSARNARRHGLRAKWGGEADALDIELLAASLCSRRGEFMGPARDAARAVVYARRVSDAKGEALRSALRDLGADAGHSPGAGQAACGGQTAGGGAGRQPTDAEVAQALLACADEIAKLDGYARRAASRRRVTMEALDCALREARREAPRRPQRERRR